MFVFENENCYKFITNFRHVICIIDQGILLKLASLSHPFGLLVCLISRKLDLGGDPTHRVFVNRLLRNLFKTFFTLYLLLPTVLVHTVSEVKNESEHLEVELLIDLLRDRVKVESKGFVAVHPLLFFIS